jgi:hypothetical protein
MGLKEFMAERHSVNRWFILGVGLVGGFCGVVLMFIFSLFAVVS